MLIISSVRFYIVMYGLFCPLDEVDWGMKIMTKTTTRSYTNPKHTFMIYTSNTLPRTEVFQKLNNANDHAKTW